MMTQTPFVVAIGSNASDARVRVNNAVKAITSEFQGVKVSSIYDTPPLHHPEAREYTNAVAFGTTQMSLPAIQAFLKNLESQAGRLPKEQRTEADRLNVNLDLDLVMWEGRIVRPADFDAPYFNIGYRELLVEGVFQFPL